MGTSPALHGSLYRGSLKTKTGSRPTEETREGGREELEPPYCPAKGALSERPQVNFLPAVLARLCSCTGKTAGCGTERPAAEGWIGKTWYLCKQWDLFSTAKNEILFVYLFV